MAHVDNINRGKYALHNIVETIRTGNDTEGWGDYEWREALQGEFEFIGDSEPGDIADIVAYVIDYFDGDVFMTARIGMYGFATVIADCVYAAVDLGETCELLD